MAMPARDRSINILLVEQDLGEARRVRELLAESELPSAVYRVEDWDEGLAFLRGVAPFSGVPVPDLLLLDLDPTDDVMERALAELRSYPGLQGLPVIALAANGSRSRSRSGFGYRVLDKPIAYDRLLNALHSLSLV